MRGQVHGQTCWDAVIKVLDIIGGVAFLKRAMRASHHAADVGKLLFAGVRPRLTRPADMQADCLVGVFRLTAEGPVQVERRHQQQLEAAWEGALSPEDRRATHPALLARDPTGAGNPVYRDALNPAAPAWAAERIVRATPVRELLQGLV